MEQHKRLTGLHYDPVIVFPQGRFSSVAMKALKNQGYFAAFNSTLKATDNGDLPEKEYQLPATFAYHNFPLFLRRYPQESSYFIQDIAMGRPIIIVEHHHAFRKGYDKITTLVDWINSLGNIRWTSLLRIAEHYLGHTAPSAQQYAKPPSSTNSFYAKVALRRMLSECRDNYIETNEFLAKAYKVLRG